MHQSTEMIFKNKKTNNQHNMDPININFDDASKEWQKNKVSIGNGAFRYRCAHFSVKKQQFCKNKPVVSSPFCHFHRKKMV